MAKSKAARTTLETELQARIGDAALMAGGLSNVGGHMRIVFPGVGRSPRFSLIIRGDRISVDDDPRQPIKAGDDEGDQIEPETSNEGGPSE